MKILYVYNRPRGKLYEDYINGNAPNDLLYGLTYMKKYSMSPYFKDDGYSGFLKNLLNPIEKITLIKLAQSLKLLPEIYRNDVIFSTTDGCGLGLSLLKSLMYIKKPHVYQTIGLKYSRFTNLPKWSIIRGIKFYRYILSNVNKIIYLTPSEKEFFKDSLKIPENRLRFIPFGIDINFFRPQKNISDEYLLSVGRDLNRDYRTLLNAIRNEDIKLKVVCSRNNLNGLLIPRNAELHFDLDFKSLKKIYAKSKFFILSTKDVDYAAGQTVMLEAMAMGKVVIASKSRGLYNSIELEDYKHCIFVKPNDVKDLKEKIQYLLNNPKEIKRMGRNARKLVERKYNSEIYAKNLSKIFLEVYNEVN